MHRRMLLIRGFEERVAALYRDGEVPGFVHLYAGEEASAIAYIQVKRADGRNFWGAGVDTNIELASVRAVLSALNRAAL